MMTEKEWPYRSIGTAILVSAIREAVRAIYLASIFLIAR